MKQNDIGIFSQFEQLSPEVMRAQRQAELENIAKYRAERLQFYLDWSDPEKRAKLQAEHAAGEKAAREEMTGKYIDDYRVRTVKNEVFLEGLQLKVNEVSYPPPVKRTWWRRICDWVAEKRMG